MIYHTIGDIITFTTSFLDADGNPPEPEDTATVTVVYPSSTPSSALLSRDPGQPKAKETLTMTVDTDGQIWTTTWDTSVSDPGTVFWYIKATGLTGIATQGSFIMKGNIAALEGV